MGTFGWWKLNQSTASFIQSFVKFDNISDIQLGWLVQFVLGLFISHYSRRAFKQEIDLHLILSDRRYELVVSEDIAYCDVNNLQIVCYYKVMGVNVNCFQLFF